MWDWLKKALGQNGNGVGGGSTLIRRSAPLLPTSEGAVLAAEGRAAASQEGTWQRFFVEITANVPDGTVLSLLMNGRPVTKIEIEQGEGEFEVATNDALPLPNGLDDVRRIKSVAIVTTDGKVLLTGGLVDAR